MYTVRCTADPGPITDQHVQTSGKDMVGLVSDGLERYNIFLNFNVPFPRSTVRFLDDKNFEL